jgi:hypothetical protein
VIFKVSFNFKYEKFRVFVTFYIPGSGAGAGPKKLRLRLQQKVAAPPAPAPQHCPWVVYVRMPAVVLCIENLFTETPWRISIWTRYYIYKSP